MGPRALVDTDIEKGKEVLTALDKSGMTVRSALWLSEQGEWRLRLRMPLVDQEGTRHGYQRVQRALHKASVDMPVWMIQLVGSSDELTSRLRAIVRTPSKAIS